MRRLGWVAGALALALTGGAALAQDDDARARQIIGGSCFLCHGAEGESASAVFPRLAGQNAAYIAKQLENFKSGKRQSTAMAPMVDKLTPEDMAALGRFYASRPPHKEPARDAPLAAVGQYIYQAGNRFSGVPACATCHGPDGAGSNALPRLAGQHAAYLDNQLRQFGKRERNNDNAVMHAVVEKMTPLEMAAVAEYLSGR
ncbi:MAG: cytochrome c4 [Burkholderiaceae bacterium]|nr:cytochrome c4 [Pseudomonadota bacterium]MBS0596270.1 cytochrome c4 [Pseudomonadota bacterium]MCO5116354.1 cytochrome c4 [Burkholderiaceae bacterium]MCP5217854.1 cytochrome c4 [Burkholderiaceae bacterium]